MAGISYGCALTMAFTTDRLNPFLAADSLYAVLLVLVFTIGAAPTNDQRLTRRADQAEHPPQSPTQA